MFPYSLESTQKDWFYALDPKKTTTWDDIAIQFNTQYRDNADTQATMRNLEILIQKDNEGFTDYLNRWKKISAQISTRPNEAEMVEKFINNLRPIYQSHMRYSNISNFKQLTTLGRRIEDDLRSGTMARLTGKGYQGSTSKATNSHSKDHKANVINALEMLTPPAHKSSGQKKEDPEFSLIPMTYTEAFKRFHEKQILHPIGPTADLPANDRSKKWNENQYCLYHRGKGHDTEKCFRLKHKIQDMIDAGELPMSKSPK